MVTSPADDPLGPAAGPTGPADPPEKGACSLLPRNENYNIRRANSQHDRTSRSSRATAPGALRTPRGVSSNDNGNDMRQLIHPRLRRAVVDAVDALEPRRLFAAIIVTSAAD